MRQLLALALAVGAMVSVRGTTTGSAATALALGFALMGASVTGDALRRFHLPRVTGTSSSGSSSDRLSAI